MSISEGSVIIIYWLNICSCKTYIIILTLLLQASVVGTEGVLIGLWQSITNSKNLGVVIYRLRSLWDRSRCATYAIGLMASSVAILIITATFLILSEVPGATIHPVIRSLNWTEDFVGYFGVAKNLHQCLSMAGRKFIPSLILEISVLVIYIAIISLRIVLIYTADGLGHFQHFLLHYKYVRNPLSMFPGHTLPLQTWWRPLLHLSFW